MILFFLKVSLETPDAWVKVCVRTWLAVLLMLTAVGSLLLEAASRRAWIPSLWMALTGSKSLMTHRRDEQLISLRSPEIVVVTSMKLEVFVAPRDLALKLPTLPVDTIDAEAPSSMFLSFCIWSANRAIGSKLSNSDCPS